MKKLLALAAVSTSFFAHASIDMAAPFTDGAILQRERPVPVWGKAKPGSKVTVAFAGNSVSTTAGEKGCWKVYLPAMDASKESRVMRVTEAEEGFLFDNVTDAVEVKDVLVGEVWFCAGQSNTECPIWGGHPRYRDRWGVMMALATRKPFVRFVKNARCASHTPKMDLKAKWMAATPEMYDAFRAGKTLPSALGYYFALELANALDIPVGLLDSSWGGTNIDAWTPPSGYEGIRQLSDVAELPLLDENAFKQAAKNGVYARKSIYGGWQQQPAALWNGMVAAYAPMACRGFIWYQGCHNNSEAERYAVKMHALYNGWAKEFENSDLKLYFVQLAPWKFNWMGICMAQTKFAQEQDNADLVVTADVGNFWDIHPNDKHSVAKRLSLHALKNDYGFSTIKAKSPVFKSMTVKKGKAELEFDYASGWYVYADDFSVKPPFQLAGTNGVWYAAKLENVDQHGNVKGTKIILSSEKVPEPVNVRYMGEEKTAGTLYNEANLPLGPFTAK